eukprot:gene8237-5758_t
MVPRINNPCKIQEPESLVPLSPPSPRGHRSFPQLASAEHTAPRTKGGGKNAKANNNNTYLYGLKSFVSRAHTRKENNQKKNKRRQTTTTELKYSTVEAVLNDTHHHTLHPSTDSLFFSSDGVPYSHSAPLSSAPSVSFSSHTHNSTAPPSSSLNFLFPLPFSHMKYYFQNNINI